MARFSTLSSGCLVLALLAPGCDDEPTLHDRVGEYADELATQVDIFCDCWQTDEYASRSECVAEYGSIGPSQRRCFEDALSRDESAASQWLDCVVQLERDYTACIDTRLVCGEYESDDDCITDYGIGYDACIQLPENISRGLDECG